MVGGLRGVSKVAYPNRLILPVKLTLQSNTRPILFTLALVVGLIWAMSHLFNLMVQVERRAKIADAPTVEIDQVRDDMAKELSGKVEGRGKLTLEQAKDGYLKNPTWRPK